MPQVKWDLISSIINFVHNLFLKLLNNLRLLSMAFLPMGAPECLHTQKILSILRNYEISGISQSVGDSKVLSRHFRNNTLVITAEKYRKAHIKVF